VQTIDENMRATLIVDFRDRKPGGRHPEQRNREIAKPNTPSRAVLKFDDVALLVFLDARTPIFA
jgi:hypothetical protein